MTKLDQLTECGVTVREATEDDDEGFGLIVPGQWYWFEEGKLVRAVCRRQRCHGGCCGEVPMLTLQRNSQVRSDLDKADAIVRLCWDNFVATEPTFALRDLIVVELAKARQAEREACALIAEVSATDHDEDTPGGRCAANAARHVAAKIRNQK